MTEHTTCLICFGPWAYADTDGVCSTCRAKLAPLTVTNVLGETRRCPSVYLDGSYTCPFCGAAAGLPDRPRDDQPCPNPWCEAHPRMPVETVLARRTEAAERKRREDDRRRTHEAAMEANAAYRERRQAEVREAREAGYCTLCFVRSGNRKRVRHRTPDYHERAA